MLRVSEYPRRVRLGASFTALIAGISIAGSANAKSFIDYVKPTPITCSPLSSATWGVAGVLPRDTCNGIESTKGARVPPEYYYWDGQIIKAKDGVYHMFMSTWAGSTGFQNWGNSEAYHAISTQGVLGPYTRKGYIWDGGSHHGHNVSAAELLDGTYAVVVSEVVPFTIYKSASLDGPWTACPGGELIRVPSGVNAGTDGHYDSNVSLTARADGKFEIVQRHGLIAIADTLCGPYNVQKPTWNYPAANRPQGIDSIYPHRTSVPDPAITNPSYVWEEDPHIWYSGGVYHVIYSGSGDRIGWHLYSADGINNWKDDGLAFDPRMYQKLFCYEGSTTCAQWYKMERPSVVLEDGHVTHLTWAVADVDKDNQIPAGSNHGSKVIVVPFDGVAFDNDYGVGGGNAGAGGAAGTGGTTGAGGGSGAGGTDGGLGGSPSGGATGRGGGIAVGGASGSVASGSGTGGATSDGGMTSHDGGAGATTGSGGSNNSSSGCSCRIQEHEPARGNAWLLLLGLALKPLVRRRVLREKNYRKSARDRKIPSGNTSPGIPKPFVIVVSWSSGSSSTSGSPSGCEAAPPSPPVAWRSCKR
jgi:MYXO-CTERM domain-containing protein